jgi:hypothetical protein
VLATPDGSVTLIVPPGALVLDTTLSITDTGQGTLFSLEVFGGSGIALFEVSLAPVGQTFLVPITVVMAWDDEPPPGDGFVDGTNLRERRLTVSKDGDFIQKTGGGQLGRCNQEPGPLATTGAECDESGNTFSVLVSSFSDFALVFHPEAVPTLAPAARLILGALLGAMGLRFVRSRAARAGRRIA